MAESLYHKFVEFEKPYGDAQNVVVGGRRLQYETEVKKNPLNYDSWFDYARLEESEDKEMVREVYERAIANVPSVERKRYWKRYIYLWINYAFYEELEAEDYSKTRDVFKACLRVFPHVKSTIATVCIMAAEFEIQQKDLKTARRTLDNAFGRAPKDKFFKRYIEMKLQLEKHSSFYLPPLDSWRVWKSFSSEDHVLITSNAYQQL